MGATTEISWTDATFNPWWGCLKVSPGCTNCYALTLSKRFGHDIWGPSKTTSRRTFGPKHWAEPLKWNKEAEQAGQRKRVFCASMADVFEDHPQLPPERAKLWTLIEQTSWLDWLLLTKRPENIDQMLPDRWRRADKGFPHNVWLGFSAEDQQRFDERWQIMEWVKRMWYPRVVFCSAEPLLGPLDISDALTEIDLGDDEHQVWSATLDWVIAGGESGRGARPACPDWFRGLRDQCQAAGISYHFKQWGEYEPYEEDAQPPFWNDQHGRMYDGHGLNIIDPESGEMGRGWHEESLCSPYAFRRVGKHAAGRLLDGREWNEMPT